MVPTGCYQRFAGGKEGYRHGHDQVGLNVAKAITRGDIPPLNLAIPIARGQSVSIRRERVGEDVASALQRTNWLSSIDFPKLNRPVPVGCGQDLAIGREYRPAT